VALGPRDPIPELQLTLEVLERRLPVELAGRCLVAAGDEKEEAQE
jgi:hypothetical protein